MPIGLNSFLTESESFGTITLKKGESFNSEGTWLPELLCDEPFFFSNGRIVFFFFYKNHLDKRGKLWYNIFVKKAMRKRSSKSTPTESAGGWEPRGRIFAKEHFGVGGRKRMRVEPPVRRVKTEWRGRCAPIWVVSRKTSFVPWMGERRFFVF